MCGIVGLADADDVGNPGAREQLCLSGLDKLTHRGPEGRTVMRFGRITMGHCQLSFQDTINAAQPIASADAAVVFNGEIYNHLDLRQSTNAQFATGSDAETLLNLYLDRGISALSELQGMYAVAIWDKRLERLILCRDRMGKKPLFYRLRDNQIYFASELSALMKLVNDTAKIDPMSLGEYLYLGSVGPTRTLVSDTYKVAPGEVIIWDLSSPDCVKKKRLDVVGFPRENSLEETLRVAVERRLASDGLSYGVLASGGLDSALIAAIARDLTGQAPTLYHVSVADERFDESENLKYLGEFLGSHVNIVNFDGNACSDLFEKEFSILDEPISDPSLLPMLCVAELARKDVKYVLTGDGADDLFAGYDLFLAKQIFDRFGATAALAVASRHASVRGKIVELAEVKHVLDRMALKPRCLAMSHARAPFSLQEIDELVTDRYRVPRSQLTHSLAADVENPDFLCLFPNSTDRRTVIRHNLQSRILSKIDRATMLKSIEGRSPFLDEVVIQKSLAYDLDDLIKGVETKWPIRALCEKYLPPKIARSPKRGFRIPLSNLLVSSMRDTVDHLLSKTQIEDDGIFQWPVVEAHLNAMKTGTGPSAQKIWTLLCFQKVIHSQSGIEI